MNPPAEEADQEAAKEAARVAAHTPTPTPIPTPRPTPAQSKVRDTLRDEPVGSSRPAISPAAFDDLTGHSQPLSGAKRLAIALTAVVIVVAGGFLLVRSRMGSDESSPPVYTQREAVPTVRPPGEPRAVMANPIGRLVVMTELPDNAWLEIDNKVYASGLGIDFPLRVAGDTTHQVAVHARGYESWQSEVYVATDSLVRLEVSLRRSPTAQAPRRTTPRTETRQPEPQPLATPRVRVDTRPVFPVALRDSLILRLEEGRVFHEIARYFDAAGEYRYVIGRLDEAVDVYRSSSVIEALKARADSSLQAVRLDCRAAGVTDCP